jgi:Glycosyl hydrolase family 115
MRTMMNFVTAYRRSSLVLLISTLSAVASASAGAPARTPKAHSRTPVQPTFVPLNSSTTILVNADEGEPIQQAVADLANDFRSVTGERAKIAHDGNDGSAVTLWIASPSKLPQSIDVPAPSGAESFSMSMQSLNGPAARKAILLTGADIRGTIYAVYEFSQEFLGVDPLYYWTDHEPPHRGTIEIPAGLSKSFPVPVSAYRGFFINDEDLLTGWAPGEAKDKTGISLEVWNKIYETILRLKGNMVAPGTWIFPDDPQGKLAAKRGLIISEHHALPLGLNVARWPKDVPYNYSEHPEILERAWKNAVNEYLPDQEVLWSVGLRGLSDVSYAAMDASVRDNNQALGALITKAIADQIRIVRAARPNPHFVTNLWQEGARLVAQGDLKIPAEVGTVWADDGYGYLQDHDEVRAGQGAYDHLAMMNGRANQLTEMVPVERSFSEIGRYIQAGATNYFLVNTSDIRPVPMSIRAVMDAVWRGIPKGATAADEFYRQWSSEEFGEKAAPRLAQLYQQYFRAPARSGDPAHEYGDQLYHTEGRLMMLAYMTDSPPLYSLPSQAPRWEPPRIVGSGFAPRGAVGKEWLNEIVNS